MKFLRVDFMPNLAAERPGEEDPKTLTGIPGCGARTSVHSPVRARFGTHHAELKPRTMALNQPADYQPRRSEPIPESFHTPASLRVCDFSRRRNRRRGTNQREQHGRSYRALCAAYFTNRVACNLTRCKRNMPGAHTRGGTTHAIHPNSAKSEAAPNRIGFRSSPQGIDPRKGGSGVRKPRKR